jgi:hypothetical protein
MAEADNPDNQTQPTPETYLDMSLEERRRFIALLHARRSREVAQAISCFIRTVCQTLVQILRSLRQN